MTSNVGARRLADFGTGIGFQGKTNEEERRSKTDAIIKKELKNKFSPEFLNRLDDIILFDQLQEEHILEIVSIELNEFIERLQNEGYIFKFNKSAKVFLAKEGYDPAYGARPLKRIIQKYVEDLVADLIISNSLEKDKIYTITKLAKEEALIVK